MNEMRIRLTSIEAVKDFVNITLSYDFDIDICSEDRHYTIDAKSLMGIFSLDLSKPVVVATKVVDDRADRLFDALSKFA